MFAGGYTTAASDIIDYIAIDTPATTATDFGNLTQVRYGPGGTSDGSRGVWGGGPSNGDKMVYVEISTQQDSSAFGDLTVSRYDGAGTSAELGNDRRYWSNCDL